MAAGIVVLRLRLSRREDQSGKGTATWRRPEGQFGTEHLRVTRRDGQAEAVPDASFALETLAGFRREEAYRTRWDSGAESLVGPVEDMLVDDPGVLKLLCRHESGSSDDLLDLARTLLDGVAVPTHSNPHDTLLEVSALGVSKAASVAELAAERGIKQSDVVAFGDMPNDLDLLAWAGRGYAMTGGHPDAIAAASHRAPPCEDDGVAQVLEALLAT